MILYVVAKIEKPDIINQEESGKKVSISLRVLTFKLKL